VIAAIVATALALAVCALLALRVRVRAQVSASADAAGSWQAAAGGAVGPLAFTAGVSPAGAAWSAHLLGRRVMRGVRVPRRAGAGTSPLRAFAAARRALRRVRFDRVEARVHGAADDPATTAQLLGLVAAAGAALAPHAHIASDADWMAERPYVDVDCAIEASFRPAAIGWDWVRSSLRARSG
jgi:hypothetical protein